MILKLGNMTWFIKKKKKISRQFDKHIKVLCGKRFKSKQNA